MLRILIGLALSALPLIPGRALAQREYALWYFGQGFGLDFREGAPVLLPGSAIWTSEGSATICDGRTGALLFYTDGVTVYDRSHVPMPHGRDLDGHASSTQSALIVPMPGDSTRYYVFTTDQEGYDGPNRGAHYSIVDMTLNGGRGDVTGKNVGLLAGSSEKLIAVPHANGSDYWVILHGLGGNTFHAYRVDASGVSADPVISAAGTVQPVSRERDIWSVGYLKASPDGRRLAGACTGSGLVELFDFDPCGGTLSNAIRLDVAASDAPYGLSFSPDGGKLYVGASRALLQYDLTRRDSGTIIASRTRIDDAADGGPAEVGGAMQMGPDGKIYTVVDGNWIGVIDHPGVAGEGCGYRAHGIHVTGAFGCYWLGLPNNIDARRQAAGEVPVAIVPAGPLHLCQGESIALDAGPGYRTYRWSTGDTTRSIVVTSAGRYAVTVTTAEGCGSATTMVLSTTPPRPRLFPDGTLYLCAGESVTIEASGGYLSYRWSNGEDGPAITVGSAGSYSVAVVDSNGCSGISAATLVLLRPLPAIPSITRDGDALLSTLSAAYQWMRDDEPLAGEMARGLDRPRPGTYRVAITDSNGCRSLSAPFTLAAEPRPPRHLVWVDTVSAVVGQHVRLRLRIEPPLSDADSALGFRAVLRVPPSAFWAHGATEGTTIDGSARDGRFVVRREGDGSRLGGDVLAWIELEGLLTGAPLDPVTIDSIAVTPDVPVAVAGPGLVVLSGCSVGRGEAFGEGLKITAVTPIPARDDAALRYLAPVGIVPTLVIGDAAGRELAARRLPPGTGDEQEARLDLRALPAGVCFVVLRSPTGRSVLPIVISR